MNYIFIPNAIALLFLGLFTWHQNPGRLSATYLVTNVSVAIWALCYMLLHEFQTQVPVNLVSQIQLLSALVFANGHFDISLRYPDPRRLPRATLRWANYAVLAILSVLILFTGVVSRAVLQEQAVVFIDGPGYAVYALYLVLLGILIISNLIISYRRYPEYRTRLAYMLTGLGLFIAFGIIFDLVLVVMGNYDWLVLGHLGSVFPSFFFAYAFSKHDLLDIRMVVDRYTAKIIVAVLATLSLYLAFQLAFSHPAASLALICLIALLWAFNASRLELFLVSTARRRFVRNWYEPEDILNKLVEKLDAVKNRADIFYTLAKEIDEVFELEYIQRIVAMRDTQENLQAYQVFESAQERPSKTLAVDDPFIVACKACDEPLSLSEFAQPIQKHFAENGFGEASKTLVIPFFSPEYLEGILILGERSSQEEFSKRDRQFLLRLLRYVGAILYRMTPFEKLEKLYFESQRRQHQAEIQVVRSDKTLAIAHATRQAHHEIRTPLNIIRMAAHRIKSADTIAKYRQIIDDQIERAMEIVDETLVITDGSDDVARFQRIDINSLLQRCVKLQAEGPQKRILDLDESEPQVLGIPGEIQVLFSNLIKNALESIPDGGTLHIRSNVELQELVVSVSDTGIGIAPELREKIWEPYFSGKVTPAGNLTAGRGWGLTICNRIVTEHKGSIQCESVLGQGSKFTVRMPIN
jgi:signal transduction histidine kinase